MMKIQNIKNYDSLTIYAKKHKSEEIINRYLTFGWMLVDKVEDAKYEDLEDITFIRPHKIPNKDDLQLLQVYMEDKLNTLGKLERNKNAKATAFGLCFGSVALAFLIIGVLAILQIITKVHLLVSISLIVLGFAILIVEIIILPSIIRTEQKEYNLKLSILEKELNQICETANNLGGKNENK